MIQQEIVERDLCDGGAVRQPQLRRSHPSLRQAGVPRLAALVVAYALAGTIRFDIERDDSFGHRRLRASRSCSAPVARTPRSTRGRRVASSPEHPPRSIPHPDVRKACRRRSKVSPLYDRGPQSTYIRRPPHGDRRAPARAR